VPASAILADDEGATIVKVVDVKNIAHDRPVQVGAREPEIVQVTGVEPGERVIKEGIGVEDKAQVRIMKSGEKALVLVLAVLLVVTVLLLEFGGFAAPVAVIASALLSTIGVFVALLLTRTTFNLSSFMGLIMVIGIVAKNGILLLDADQRFRAEGLSPEDSMIQAGERRLRPILMTALATMAGMIPLALGLGAGSQMLQPLAIAVIGGILASMVLSLVITPAVHYYLAGGETREVKS